MVDSIRDSAYPTFISIIEKGKSTEMLDSPESVPATLSPLMGKKVEAAPRAQRVEANPGQAERLKGLRAAYGYQTNASFAAFLGLPVTTYNPAENGSRLSIDVATRIVQRIPGMTLDYLYFGKPDALPLDVLRRLGLMDPGKRTS
ncbi:hypothetical protein [Bradyrhizobium sp.]|uniref:hypothetical protein n=1 Tax=Bradyrhizobium sp. TaxID=376 RepID=UPI0039E3065B